MTSYQYFVYWPSLEKKRKMFPKEQLSHFSLSAVFFFLLSVGCVFVFRACSVRNGGIHAVSSASTGTRQPVGALRLHLRLCRSQPRAHGSLRAAPRQAARGDGDVPRLPDHPLRPSVASHHLHQGSRAPKTRQVRFRDVPKKSRPSVRSIPHDRKTTLARTTCSRISRRLCRVPCCPPPPPPASAGLPWGWRTASARKAQTSIRWTCARGTSPSLSTCTKSTAGCQWYNK